MEFADVVRRRRMVRRFTTDPIPAPLVDTMLAMAQRAPSAGNTGGTHFVVLEGAETARYWDITLPIERRDRFPWPGLLLAPVLVLPCGDQRAYVDRYSEPDKSHSGLGVSADAWTMPYWHVDTAMATMTLLHAAVDAGVGALFFGLFEHEPAVADALGLPTGVRPIGTVALGWPAPGDRPSQSAARGRPPVDDIIHRGRW